MIKKAFIIHGWSDTPSGSWFPWLQKNLEERGFEVEVPAMPHPDTPTIEDWVGHLKKIITQVDENTLLVGHSVGCQTILRFLAALPESEKVGQVVLVAPWLALSGIEKDEEGIARPWLEESIDFARVRQLAENITALFSSNDKFVPQEENVALFEKALQPKIVYVGDKGHISGFDNPPILELPELLDIIL